MSEEIESLKEAEKDYLDEESNAMVSTKKSNNWIPGVVLIAIGVIFLLSNTTGFYLNNWWALFIFIPAISNFNTAYRSYQRHGRLTKGARGSVTGGLILSLVASAFLFNWDWGFIWPVFLIIGGLSVLVGGWFD